MAKEPEMKKRVADIIMDTLADNGVEQAFCVVGGGSMFLNNALGISRRIKTIFNHHEQACAMAAEGYARYMTNKPALVCVTSGPGGTNTLTGVYGAYVDSIPMIVVSGQCRYNTSVPDAGVPLRSRGVQEFNIVDTVKTMTKYSKMVIDPLEIKREVQKSYDIAMNGRRGPVWLDIPQNVQNTMVEEDDLLPVLPAPETVKAKEEDIEKLYSLLKEAKRPVILAGSGIRYSGNYDAFLSFLSSVKVPVVNAASQPDLLYRNHPLFVGAEGLTGQRAGNFVLQNADVVLVLGASLTFSETGWVQENFASEAHIVMVNIDEYEHRKPGMHVDTFIHADLVNFFEKTKSFKIEPAPEWLEYAEKVKARFDPFEGAAETTDGKVNPYSFWKTYAKKIPEDGLTCLGNSSSIAGWLRYGNSTKTQRTMVNINCGSMGDDITLATGVAAAAERPVLMQTGDGSFMMNLQEMATIAHNKLPVKIVVFSNGGYNALRNTFKNYFNGVNTGCDYDSGISFPNFEKMAAAFAFPYRRCETNEDIENSLDWLLGQTGFAFLEVEQTLDPIKAPCVISRLRPDGTSEPAWLQDMSPFIERDEYKDLMISKNER